MVSCGEKAMYEYDLTEKEFKPTITARGGQLETAEATKEYLSMADENKQIIADDLAFTFFQIGFPGLGYKKLSIKSISTDINKSMLSLSFRVEGEVPQGTGGDVLTSEDISFENIPVAIDYVPTETPYSTKWGMSTTIDTDGQWLLQNDKWHFYQKDIYKNSGILEHDWNKEKLEKDPEQVADIWFIMAGLAFSLPSLSYYLSQTTPA